MTLEQLERINRSKRETIARAKRYTDELIAIIKSSPGPVCFVIRGLDGFSCHLDRILSFLRRLHRLGYILKFMLLIDEREHLTNDCDGFKVSWCSSGSHPVLFSSDSNVKRLNRAGMVYAGREYSRLSHLNGKRGYFIIVKVRFVDLRVVRILRVTLDIAQQAVKAKAGALPRTSTADQHLMPVRAASEL